MPTAKLLHACTHTTISPNVVHGGVKSNVIPDKVQIDVDIRTLPGVTGDDVNAKLREAVGDLADRIEIEAIFNDEASQSSTATPMSRPQKHTQVVYPRPTCCPS